MPEEKMYNHKQRRFAARRALKQEKIPVDNWIRDESGEFKQVITHWTTSYRKMIIKERYDYNAWFDRVKKSQEYGKKVSNIIEEMNYNKFLEETEAREAKNLSLLIELHGEEKGKELHNERLKRFEEKMTKKYNS